MASTKPGQFDYSMVNVAWCSDLEIIEEPNEPPEALSTLNIQKVNFLFYNWCFEIFVLMCNVTLIVREEETSEHRKQKQGDKLTWQGRDPAGSAFIFHYLKDFEWSVLGRQEYSCNEFGCYKSAVYRDKLPSTKRADK